MDGVILEESEGQKRDGLMLAWPGISTDFWNKEDISMFIVREEETSNERVT